MNMFRGALLGTAAALTFGAGAQAADLPSRKAAPVAYVKICDVYGRGFYYIPGTNTCLRVGGRVRFVLAYRPSTNVWRHRFNNRGTYADGRLNDTIGWRARAYVNLDARTQTAWGTLQTVISVALRSRSGMFNGSGDGARGSTSADPQVYAAYIRFAGFTVGRARGNFYFMPSRMLEPQYYSSSSTGEVQLAYTAVLGGGLSATLAIEDRSDFGYGTRFSGLNVGGIGFPTDATGGIPTNRSAVVIGNVRIDQGWGRAQVMAAYMPNQWLVNTTASGIQSADKAGWAIGAGLMLNLPSLAKGDKIHFMAAYADGALDFTHSRYATGNTSHGRAMGGARVEYADVLFYYDPISGALRSASNTSWSIATIFEHYWSRNLKSNFAASYLNIDAPAIACAQNWYTSGGVCGTKAYSIAANLEWSPTRGFVIIGEVAYRKNINNFGSAGPVWGSAAADRTIGVKKNPDMFFGRLRVERTF